MASISRPEAPASSELLARILAHDLWSDDLLRRALEEDCGRAFLSIVVERLADLFEPDLCDAYAPLFARVIEMHQPDICAAELVARYERVRQVRPAAGREVKSIVVLSRVTLGADVAVTSVILNALHTRYPSAEIALAGPAKNHELFGGAGWLQHVRFPYPRAGTLAERLAGHPRFTGPDMIVVDPDSRLTQSGILPVCEEADYYFFESRSFGGDGRDPLPVLASNWTEAVFGTTGHAWTAPQHAPMSADVAVSFGTGGNPSKRIPGIFEEEIVRHLTSRGLSVVLDAGAGGDETVRARELAERAGRITLFEGPFAPFASMICQARLYVGYDSAGGHVAAAAGTPLVSVFVGHVSDRMFYRWQPYGSGPRRVIKVDSPRSDVLQHAIDAIDELLEVQHA